MRKKRMNWLVAICLPLALMMAVGCSTGTGDDDDDTTGTPSPSASPTPNFVEIVQMAVVARFGLQTQARRDYNLSDGTNVPISMEVILLNQAQDAGCIVAIDQPAADTANWTTASIPDGSSSSDTMPGNAALNLGLNFAMGTANTQHVAIGGGSDCTGILNDAIWTANVAEGIRNAAYGFAGHDNIEPATEDGMDGTNGNGGQIMDPEWTDEWVGNYIGAGFTLGAITAGDFWGMRSAQVDGSFNIVDMSWNTAVDMLNTGNEPDGAYVTFSPFVIGLGSEQALADLLLGNSAVAPSQIQIGEPVKFEELGIDMWRPTTLNQ